MKEYKWSVGLRHKATRERLNVTVWAPKNEIATQKLCSILIGPECEYEWTGTGPVYENNQTVSREVHPVCIVEWDDHEGSRHQRVFEDLESAQLEADSLRRQFDFVQVRGEELYRREWKSGAKRS